MSTRSHGSLPRSSSVKEMAVKERQSAVDALMNNTFREKAGGDETSARAETAFGYSKVRGGEGMGRDSHQKFNCSQRVVPLFGLVAQWKRALGKWRSLVRRARR
jgi:hypothetical protein